MYIWWPKTQEESSLTEGRIIKFCFVLFLTHHSWRWWLMYNWWPRTRAESIIIAARIVSFFNNTPVAKVPADVYLIESIIIAIRIVFFCLVFWCVCVCFFLIYFFNTVLLRRHMGSHTTSSEDLSPFPFPILECIRHCAIAHTGRPHSVKLENTTTTTNPAFKFTLTCSYPHLADHRYFFARTLPTD